MPNYKIEIQLSTDIDTVDAIAKSIEELLPEGGTLTWYEVLDDTNLETEGNEADK